MLIYDNKTFAIYCVGEGEFIVPKQLDDSPQLYSVYNINDKHDKSLDLLNTYFADLTAQYFIYKNNIKTDYVGFCQYDGIISLNIKNFMEENGLCYGQHANPDSWANMYKHTFLSFLKEDLNTYITKNYNKKSRIYKSFITNANNAVNFYVNRRYMCKWEYFTEIMGFVSGFIEYINDTYELKWDKNEWHYFILDNFIDKKLTQGVGDDEPFWLSNGGKALWAVFALLFEVMIGVYFANIVEEFNLPQYEIQHLQKNESDKS
jgi:hypothetical protein